MNSKSSKSIIVNIITVILVLGVLALGYVTFMKGNVTTSVGTASQTNLSVLPDSSTNTLTTSLRVAQTAKDLKELSRSVEESSILFNSKKAFQDLVDFSVSIPSEPAGRENPFVKTSWRLNFEELERAAEKKISQQVTVTSVVSTTPTPITTTPSSSSSVPTFSNPAPDEDPQDIQT